MTSSLVSHAIRQCSDWIFALDVERRVLFQSESCRTILVGDDHGPFQLKYPGNAAAETFDALIERVLTTGESGQQEIWMQVSAGIQLPVEVHVSRFHGETEATGGVLVVGHDISDRTRAEHKRFAVEKQFRALYESSRDAILTVEPTIGFLAGNPSAVALFGCQNEAELIALSPSTTSPERQPDGRFSDEKAAEMMSHAIERGSHLFDWMHRKVSGDCFWAEVLLTRMDRDGAPILQASVRDITDRRVAADQIRALNQELEQRIAERTSELIESSERTHKLIDAASDAVVTIDDHSLILEWNPAAERIFGWSQSEAIGQKMHHLIVPEKFRPMHEAGMRRFIESGEGTIINQTIEVRALRRDGSEFDIELAIWPVKSGRSYTFSAFLRDISQRKKVEIRQIEQTEQIRVQRDVLMELAQIDKTDFSSALARILQASARTLKVRRVSFWRLDEHLKFIECSQMHDEGSAESAEAIQGLRLDATDYPRYLEAIQKRQTLVVDDALTHPATSEFAETYLKPHGISSMIDVAIWFQGKSVGVVCHEHVGEARAWASEEVDFASSIATMISLALEASNRAQAEAELIRLQNDLRVTLSEREAVLENSSVGICLVRNQKFTWVNHTMQVLTGYSSDLLIGKPLSFVYPVAATSEFSRGLSARFGAGESYSMESQMECTNQSLTWTRLSGRALNRANLDEGSIWTVEDISERMRAEQEIRNALEKERELNELKSRFVSMTSHEFRTPLSTILSSAELLEHYSEKLPTQDRLDLYRSIETAVKRMTDMLNDVLIIGRAESENTGLQKTPLDVSEFCRDLAEQISRSAPPEVVITVHADTHAILMLDESILSHILSNLLSNAVKYSPSGGKVTFSVNCSPTHITFQISDEGIGIPEEEVPRVFDSFHRAKNVGNIPGTGLGLSIVKKSVDQHGGTIHVTSQVGMGTTFSVEIPLEVMDA